MSIPLVKDSSSICPSIKLGVSASIVNSVSPPITYLLILDYNNNNNTMWLIIIIIVTNTGVGQRPVSLIAIIPSLSLERVPIHNIVMEFEYNHRLLL